jgi:hypothetical protein
MQDQVNAPPAPREREPWNEGKPTAHCVREDLRVYCRK